VPDTGRRVVFEGAVNFRDLGGLRAAGGAVVRRHRLFRSDSLHGLTSGDLTRLHDELGVRTVLDLRMDSEVDEHGPPLGHFRDHVRWLRLPLFTSFRPEWAEPSAWATESLRAQRYLEFIESGSAQLARLVIELSQPEGTPAVVHCQVGRDRTGVAVALVLELLGVERGLIGEDYAVSARYITEFPLSADRMTALLGLIDSTYGSTASLLREHGVQDSHVAALRAALLV